MKSFRVYKKLRGEKETKKLYTIEYMHIYKIISNGQTAK